MKPRKHTKRGPQLQSNRGSIENLKPVPAESLSPVVTGAGSSEGRDRGGGIKKGVSLTPFTDIKKKKIEEMTSPLI